MDTEVFDLSSEWSHCADFGALPATRVQSEAGSAGKLARDLSTMRLLLAHKPSEC